jgi:hypothetical protein
MTTLKALVSAVFKGFGLVNVRRRRTMNSAHVLRNNLLATRSPHERHNDIDEPMPSYP